MSITIIDKLSMSLDDIIKHKKTAQRTASTTPAPPKAAKVIPPKQNAGPPRRNNRADSTPKGQWRHDRFGVDEPFKNGRNRGRNTRSPPYGRNGKNQDTNGKAHQREGPLLSRATREAQAKSGPLTTAQLRANARRNSYGNQNNRNNRNRAKHVERSPERSPERSYKPQPAPQETNVSIKGAAGPTTILVSNLDPEANTLDLRECFGKFGELLEVSLLYDEHSRCSGNAEIKFGTRTEAQKAVNYMHLVRADDRTLIVQLKPDSTPSKPTPPRQEARPAPAPRQETRVAPAPAPTRVSSGPVRSSHRASIQEKPYSRPARREYRR